MKFLLGILVSLPVVASSHFHLPLELTFEESQKLYASLLSVQKSDSGKKDIYITAAIEGGEKMSEWIKAINSQRSEQDAIRLTSKATQRGIPVDRPSKYGPKIIRERLEKLQAEMPEALREVIYGKAPISQSTILSDSEFIQWCRKVSGLYQTAVRWESYQPWLGQMSRRKYRDIRGYYHLKKINGLDQKLETFDQLPQEEQNQLKQYLLGICLNKEKDTQKCESEFVKAKAKNSILTYKKRYWSTAKSVWDSFFVISNPRRDVQWDSPELMFVVFKDPQNLKVANWLKDNVEDEFQIPLNNWRMEMSFKQRGWGLAYIEFRKNVTPHVSGGNKIVMDANTALEEYGVRWTIRHEYGHILRLPDCYHEFYDSKENIMINYQLDVTDLMCSRRGSMNDRIYNELKRVYYKKN